MKRNCTFESELLAAGYVKDDASKVWCRGGSATPFAYTDGVEIERRLLDDLRKAEDVSVGSPDLAKRVVDWPSEYHFDARRANLLRPIESLLKGRVLEIGAGCGAISRFLGECEADVLALEGSFARSSVASERCRDLPNVTVVCERFDAFPLEREFDVVLLVGVLEYARIFAPAGVGDPIQWMLTRARSAMKPGGALVVAIENQLGLKYFAGCGEDHIGSVFYGVQGLYKGGEAVTFGRRQLSRRIADAGLPEQRLLLPFPDYKIPDCIVDERACLRADFDAASFVGLTTGRDYSGTVPKAFTEPLVWRPISENGLLPDVSNSFLLTAGESGSNVAKSFDVSTPLAWSFSSGRRSQFNTSTEIIDFDGALVVRKRLREGPVAGQDQQAQRWTHHVKSEDAYVYGERLDVALLRAAATNDQETLESWAGAWLDLLLSKAELAAGGDQTLAGAWWCEGDSVDLVPRNLVIGTDSSLHVFDQEWACRDRIPLSWVLIRGVLGFATLGITGDWLRSRSVFDLARGIAERRGLLLVEQDIDAAQLIDSEFLAWVKGEGATGVSWQRELVTRPIGELSGSLLELARAGIEPVSPAQLNDAAITQFQTELDAERIAHAKLIGAYEGAEKSNRSLIDQLAAAQAYAAVVLSQRESAEKRSAQLQERIEELEAAIAEQATQDPLPKDMAVLRAQLDEERIAHAKLIGAYQSTEESNRSLVEQLNAAHAYAAEVLAQRTNVESRTAELEQRLAEMASSLSEASAYQKVADDLRTELMKRVAELEVVAEANAFVMRLSDELQNLRAVLEIERAEHRLFVDEHEELERSHADSLFSAAQLASDVCSERLAFEREREAVLAELTAATQDLGRLEASLAEHLATQSELESQVQQLRGAWTVQRSELEVLEQNSNMTAQELAAARARGEELAEQLKAAAEEKRNLDATIAHMERQQAAMSAELLRLNAERATFGAALGRAITRARAYVAPTHTKRGRMMTLAGRFAKRASSSGMRSALSTTMTFVSLKATQRKARLRKAAPSAFHSTPAVFGEREMAASDPQLAAWLAKNEPDAAALQNQRRDSDDLTYKPVFSVIVPIYRVPREVLDETLASLERQTYPYWQGCLVWSDVGDEDGWAYAAQRVAADKRFKLHRLDENGGISLNSNAALELADGEFIALLDHDDTLTPWALYDVAKLLQKSPELDFIYSDKDGITADGSMRLNALFKPAWSPQMLHSVNYLTHLNVIRTALVREIGGWRPETDGAQDWDLFFRITERTKNIARVPSIHYHWRILPTSTATGLQAKPYAVQGQLRSQQDHFKRRKIPATVLPSAEGMFQICWPARPASVDVAVFQSGSEKQLVNVLDVLRAGNLQSMRHINVVHRGPRSAALQAFEGVWPGRITFVQDATSDWSAAISASLNGAETLLLIDGAASGLSDTIVEELGGWVAHHPDVAWASAIALNPDGTVYEAGRVVGKSACAPLFAGSPLFSFGWFGGPLWYRNVSACSPYAIAMPLARLRQVWGEPHPSGDSRQAFSALCQALCDDDKRGLVNPFARIYFAERPETEWVNAAANYYDDPYFNPSFESVSPLRLTP